MQTNFLNTNQLDELVVHVLSFFEEDELQIYRGINRRFKQIIDGSPVLHENLPEDILRVRKALSRYMQRQGWYEKKNIELKISKALFNPRLTYLNQRLMCLDQQFQQTPLGRFLVKMNHRGGYAFIMKMIRCLFGIDKEWNEQKKIRAEIRQLQETLKGKEQEVKQLFDKMQSELFKFQSTYIYNQKINCSIQDLLGKKFERIPILDIQALRKRGGIKSSKDMEAPLMRGPPEYYCEFLVILTQSLGTSCFTTYYDHTSRHSGCEDLLI